MEIKRRYYIDILRILACFMVVFNHFDLGFYAFHNKQQGTVSYWLLLAFSVFCKYTSSKKFSKTPVLPTQNLK